MPIQLLLRNLCIILNLCLVFSSAVKAQAITYHDNAYFLNGTNIPWNAFGWDFGEHDVWGVGYKAEKFEKIFTDLEAHGVNCARVWVHCDGRANPEFDDNGFVTGFDDTFFDHLDNLFEKAHKHNVLLILCLWSFDMTKDERKSSGRYAGLHADLIRNSAKTCSYVDNALIPMVKRYKDQCNLLAWEIINEPEWSMNLPNTGTTFQTVTAKEMQQFIGACASAIHQHSNKMVTVGAASLKWNCDEVGKNYWSDEALASAGVDVSTGYLDFYSVHYYKWMDKDGASPYAKVATDMKLNKPLLIGEVPPNSLTFSKEQQLRIALNNKYVGVLFWSYVGDDKYANWSQYCEAHKTFHAEQANRINFQHACYKLSTKAKSDKKKKNQSETIDKISVKIRTNETDYLLYLDYKLVTEEAVFVDLVNINKKVVFSTQLDANSPTLTQESHLMDRQLQGTYTLVIKTTNQIIQREQFLLGHF